MPDSPDALHRAVAARYAGASRFTRNFVPSKLKRDPATAAILGVARGAGGFGHVVDLGCGRGQFGLLLLLAGLADRVTGLDLDGRKIAEANGAAAGLAATFQAADLSRAAVPEGDTVLMADVLYQLPDGAQRRVLDGMARAARRRVVMRLFDPDRGLRSAFGMAMERAGRALRRDGAAVEPMPVAGVAAVFEAAGFRCAVEPCWAGTPFPNVLLVARRGA